MATAVATRTTVATNIAQAACEKTKNDFANAKELSKKKQSGQQHTKQLRKYKKLI